MSTEKIKREDWIFMPHPAHFICARDCKFFLATKIGKYIVSTVGEYLPDSRVRQITADVRGIKIEGMGDYWDADYMKKIGFEELHPDGILYETMVFNAVKNTERGERACKSCPFQIESGNDIDTEYYKTGEEAYEGHYKMCDKYSNQ